MVSQDGLTAFMLAAELGSFSAAARRIGKVQSAISTAIANLEIDTGVTLFDRSGRLPVLTDEGRALLPYARAISLGQKELMAKAGSLSEGIEHRLSVAIEQGLSLPPVLDALSEFAQKFPTVELELLSPGVNDTPELLISGRTDLGLMSEQESYPLGFQFRGVGHTALVMVCSPTYPLAGVQPVDLKALREHRQIVLHSRSKGRDGSYGNMKSPLLWEAENSSLIVEMVKSGLGWAELPYTVVHDPISQGRLTKLSTSFQQSDDLAGVDVVWTERRGLGAAGSWLRDRLMTLPQEAWRG
ncbi:putative HTH-type transcriptional regulator YahB [Aliiroseovarius pelagivivens]|uniref:Putative HTH-type transcriptional regulator YahB n=1 Tax=Aliiroseovarius pelagivivens TaxID=1639690 RepID=A0A2R8AH05_9RHOB|nr:LysR family transcriptional regulator [Aliiroseovarius pelagivivens]SPF75316.1 putative HTH-type transcriptional regulator YahB [Aliiroseovarius pelagivivens]